MGQFNNTQLTSPQYEAAGLKINNAIVFQKVPDIYSSSPNICTSTSTSNLNYSNNTIINNNDFTTPNFIPSNPQIQTSTNNMTNNNNLVYSNNPNYMPNNYPVFDSNINNMNNNINNINNNMNNNINNNVNNNIPPNYAYILPQQPQVQMNIAPQNNNTNFNYPPQNNNSCLSQPLPPNSHPTQMIYEKFSLLPQPSHIPTAYTPQPIQNFSPQQYNFSQPLSNTNNNNTNNNNNIYINTNNTNINNSYQPFPSPQSSNTNFDDPLAMIDTILNSPIENFNFPVNHQ